MAEQKKTTGKGGGVGLGLDFSLNPCSSMLLLLILPPAFLVMWLISR